MDIIAEETPIGDYENDSLDEQEDAFNIVDVIPESPLDDVNNSNYDSYDLSIQSNNVLKLFPQSMLSKNCLPKEIYVMDQNGKILDIRDKIKFKKSTNQSFKKMRFKDFKEAKKRIEIGKKMNLSRKHNNVKENMENVKKTLAILWQKIDEMKHKEASYDFVKNRKSIFPISQVLVDETKEMCNSEGKDSLEGTDDSLEKINDSLENSLADDRKQSLIASKSGQQIKNDEISLDRDSLEDSLESIPDSLIYPTTDDTHNISQESVKLIVYKGASKNKISSKSNASIPTIRNYECEKLFKTLCQNCQNYYSTRKLSENGIRGLLERCAKHRGYRTAYRSPPHFWNIDFDNRDKKPKKDCQQL